MKLNVFLLTLIISAVFSVNTFGQATKLIAGQTVEKKLLKGEDHLYTFFLKKGEYATLVVMQKGVDLAVDIKDPSGKKLNTVDSPNGKQGPEPVSIEALQTGNYQLSIYPMLEQTGMSDAEKTKWAEEDQGDYAITDIKKLTIKEYEQKLAKIAADKNVFAQWVANNANEIKSVDAGSGFEDLQVFKSVLKDVRVVGFGEASHGTSEFFRMKHRMLEFLVKEMGFTSFYIEASMSRCRYINNYVLTGKGNLDTATAIQGFVTWRVEEVKNMIGWMRQYNASVPDEKKVKFYGYDLQVNDAGWKELKAFYSTVNPSKLPHLDSLQSKLDTAAKISNNTERRMEGAKLFKDAYKQCLTLMDDMVLNQGQYAYITDKQVYDENELNIRLIVEEVESYQEGFNDRRDYYMAQNILYLLNHEKPNTKVMVWAHNGHIQKKLGDGFGSMGGYLANTLKDKYYAVGFEFYSGSFQTRNMDINNKSKNWDVMSVGEPPAESLAWYFNKAGKTKFFIDFRNTGADKVAIFPNMFNMHSFGSMNSAKWPQIFPDLLTSFDGMIYIKESTAAKNLTTVYLR